MERHIEGCTTFLCRVTVFLILEVIAVVVICANGVEVLTVNEPADVLLAPLNCIGMHFARVVEFYRVPHDAIQRPFETVVCSEENVLVLSPSIHHFENVGLTRRRPNPISCVARQHPYSGPQTLAWRRRRAYLDAAEFEVKFIKASHARGGVRHTTHVLATRCNRQHPIRDGCVFCLIVLLLRVAPPWEAKNI